MIMDDKKILLDYRNKLSSVLPVDDTQLESYKSILMKAIKWTENHVQHYWHQSFFYPEQKISVEDFELRVVFAEGEAKFYIFLPDGETFYIDINNKGYDNVSVIYKPHLYYTTRLKIEPEEKSILQQLIDTLMIKRYLQEKAEIEELKRLEKHENPLLFMQYKNERRKLSLLKGDYKKEDIIEHLHNKAQILIHNYNLKWNKNITLLVPYTAKRIPDKDISIKDSFVYLPFHLYGHCTNCKESIDVNLLEERPLDAKKINEEIHETVVCQKCNTVNVFEFNLSLSLNLTSRTI